MIISNIIDKLPDSETHAYTKIHVSMLSTSDAQDILVKSSASLYDTRYLILESRIEKETKHKIIDISIIASEFLELLIII